MRQRVLRRAIVFTDRGKKRVLVGPSLASKRGKPICMASVVVWPTCPICLKRYGSEKVVPLLLYPCGHGVCEECFEACQDHGGASALSCSVCRRDVEHHSVNYDLRNAVTDDDRYDMSACEDAFMSYVSLSFPAGHEVRIDDALAPWLPLIVFRLTDSVNIDRLKSILCKLTLEKSIMDVYHWIEVLDFSADLEARIFRIVRWMQKSMRFLDADHHWLLRVLCDASLQ